jgi:hypothetical protein
MNISPEEAAEALQQIKASQMAMRHAIRAYRGHYYLWIWGTIWMATAVIRWMDHRRFYIATNWLTAVGIVISLLVGFSQAGKLRGKIDRRFFAACATLLLFGYGVWPLFIPNPFQFFDRAFGYQQLIFMQIYIVGGIWFDNSLLWTGLIVAAVTVAGLLCFPAYFWVAILLGGATLVGSGFYVRRSWR